MSKFRIALVAEGPTDQIVIQAALEAILPCDFDFVLVMLQPEPTRSQPTQQHMEGGWCGVFKWCRAAGKRCQGSLDGDPSLAGFDMLIMHVDADVADKRYSDCNNEPPSAWAALPCGAPCAMAKTSAERACPAAGASPGNACQPVLDTFMAMQEVLASWLGSTALGGKTVLCIPSKSTGTWLAAAHLSPQHALLNRAGVECDLGLESQLAQLPLKERIKKSKKDFQQHATTVTENWGQVTGICSQAQGFERRIRQVVAGS